MIWLTFGPLLCSLVSQVASIDPSKSLETFFNKDGSQFFIQVYTEQCRRDASLMKDFGANARRVYHVDAEASHEGCMKAFADTGIYVLVDIDTFDTYITPSNQCWSTRQRDIFADVMDIFQKYDNLLAFFVDNESIAQMDHSPGAHFIKSAARDMKPYRKSKGYRKIPIGYSAADNKELRPMLQNYLTCGGNSNEPVDFFGLNSSSWCDPSTYENSAYSELQEHARDFTIPIFFTEMGCNVPGPRLWEDQDAIFGKNMTGDWSGAIVYEWIEEQNNYSIISYGPLVGDPTRSDELVFDDWTRRGTPTPISPDFENLKTVWASAHPTGINKGE